MVIIKPRLSYTTISMTIQSIRRWLKLPSVYFQAEHKKEKWLISTHKEMEIEKITELTPAQERDLKSQIVVRWLFGGKFKGLQGFYLTGNKKKKIISIEYEVCSDEIELSKAAFQLFDNSWKVFKIWIEEMFKNISVNTFRDVLKKSLLKHSPEEIWMVKPIISRLSNVLEEN